MLSLWQVNTKRLQIGPQGLDTSDISPAISHCLPPDSQCDGAPDSQCDSVLTASVTALLTASVTALLTASVTALLTASVTALQTTSVTALFLVQCSARAIRHRQPRSARGKHDQLTYHWGLRIRVSCGMIPKINRHFYTFRKQRPDCSQCDGAPDSQCDGTPNSQCDSAPDSQCNGAPDNQCHGALPGAVFRSCNTSPPSAECAR
ncbi:hypothetical protein ACOMHN_031246 [Nucella lapillus]